MEKGITEEVKFEKLNKAVAWTLQTHFKEAKTRTGCLPIGVILTAWERVATLEAEMGNYSPAAGIILGQFRAYAEVLEGKEGENPLYKNALYWGILAKLTLQEADTSLYLKEVPEIEKKLGVKFDDISNSNPSLLKKLSTLAPEVFTT